MRYFSTLFLGACLATSPFLVGCDRTVSHTESTEQQPNGTVVHKDDTVKQDQNGNTVHDQTKTVDKP
jgi:hypothetical protein